MSFNKLIPSTLAAYIMFVGLVMAYSGDATYYYAGLGNCGSTNKDTDYIVALSTQEYNGGSHCYSGIQVTYEGKTIDVTVVDSCTGCSEYSIDLSESAFQALAPLSTGRISVTWSYT